MKNEIDIIKEFSIDLNKKTKTKSSKYINMNNIRKLNYSLLDNYQNPTSEFLKSNLDLPKVRDEQLKLFINKYFND